MAMAKGADKKGNMTLSLTWFGNWAPLPSMRSKGDCGKLKIVLPLVSSLL